MWNMVELFQGIDSFFLSLVTHLKSAFIIAWNRLEYMYWENFICALKILENFSVNELVTYNLAQNRVLLYWNDG